MAGVTLPKAMSWLPLVSTLHCDHACFVCIQDRMAVVSLTCTRCTCCMSGSAAACHFITAEGLAWAYRSQAAYAWMPHFDQHIASRSHHRKGVHDLFCCHANGMLQKSEGQPSY